MLAETTADGAAISSVRLVVVVHPATVFAGTTFEGAALASVRLVSDSSASHCVGEHEK